MNFILEKKVWQTLANNITIYPQICWYVSKNYKNGIVKLEGKEKILKIFKDLLPTTFEQMEAKQRKKLHLNKYEQW